MIDRLSAGTRATSLVPYALWALSIGTLIYGAYQVWHHWWLCDDAFISFRYAQNLVNGHGLVYNVGERVEGYTNFLWTIIISFFMLLELRPEPVSMVLGAASYFATVGILGYLSWRLFNRAEPKGTIFFPLAAMCVLVQHDYHVFATSGLETSWTAMLVTLGYALLVLARSPRSYLWAGIVLILAALSRPDAMLFYAMGIPYLLLLGRMERRYVFLYLVPLVIMYLPYWVARYLYYGFPFPNTYYAKSANLPYYSQGIAYLKLYFKAYYSLMLLGPAALAVILFRFRALVSLRSNAPVYRALALGILFAVPYTAYVVRSGGDFMFARFFIPVTPILFLFLEATMRLFLVRTWAYVPVSLVVLAGVLFRWDPYTETRKIDYVAYEPDYYPRSWVEHAEEVGTRMREYFKGTDTRVAFYGMFAVYVYYAEPSMAIESNAGLTDTFIAHMPIFNRGRPGHEKQAPWEYLVHRGVNFVFRGKVPMNTPTDSLRAIRFGDFESHIIVYNRALMDHLKQFPEIAFVDFPAFLDGYIARMPSIPNDALAPSYQFFRQYYFDHNDDPARQRPFITRLGG
ncbi:MAG: hypothetical protein AB1644_11545 [Candidatus Zixiibacteriota bacterium]